MSAILTTLVIASVYGAGETHVATGARFDANGMTAAHRTLPFGTQLTLRHGRRAIVIRIADRGPFIKGRTLDLTPAVAKYLQCGGLCRVRIEAWPPLPKPRPQIPEPKFAWGKE